MADLDALGIVAADVDRSVAFYRSLGVAFSAVEPGAGHVEAVLPSGFRLMIDSEEVMRSFSDWSPPTGGGRRVALAMRCASPADVDETFARVEAAGFGDQVQPFDAPWGQRYATVADPDGNPVDLYADMA